VDEGLLAEADFGLGGVDVDVDLLRGHLEKEEDYGERRWRDDVAVGVGEGVEDELVADEALVDEDVDVQDLADVTLKVLNNIDPERDIQLTLGPIDSLDHASRLANYGSKMGIDATRKWPTEGFTRPWPDEIVMDAKTKALVDSKWKTLAKELGID